MVIQINDSLTEEALRQWDLHAALARLPPLRTTLNIRADPPGAMALTDDSPLKEDAWGWTAEGQEEETTTEEFTSDDDLIEGGDEEDDGLFIGAGDDDDDDSTIAFSDIVLPTEEEDPFLLELAQEEETLAVAEAVAEEAIALAAAAAAKDAPSEHPRPPVHFIAPAPATHSAHVVVQHSLAKRRTALLKLSHEELRARLEARLRPYMMKLPEVPPLRRRKRPNCLFVNHMGTRNSPTALQKKRKAAEGGVLKPTKKRTPATLPVKVITAPSTPTPAVKPIVAVVATPTTLLPKLLTCTDWDDDLVTGTPTPLPLVIPEDDLGENLQPNTPVPHMPFDDVMVAEYESLLEKNTVNLKHPENMVAEYESLLEKNTANLEHPETTVQPKVHLEPQQHPENTFRLKPKHHQRNIPADVLADCQSLLLEHPVPLGPKPAAPPKPPVTKKRKKKAPKSPRPKKAPKSPKKAPKSPPKTPEAQEKKKKIKSPPKLEATGAEATAEVVVTKKKKTAVAKKKKAVADPPGDKTATEEKAASVVTPEKLQRTSSETNSSLTSKHDDEDPTTMEDEHEPLPMDSDASEEHEPLPPSFENSFQYMPSHYDALSLHDFMGQPVLPISHPSYHAPSVVRLRQVSSRDVALARRPQPATKGRYAVALEHRAEFRPRPRTLPRPMLLSPEMDLLTPTARYAPRGGRFELALGDPDDDLLSPASPTFSPPTRRRVVPLSTPKMPTYPDQDLHTPVSTRDYYRRYAPVDNWSPDEEEAPTPFGVAAVPFVTPEHVESPTDTYNRKLCDLSEDLLLEPDLPCPPLLGTPRRAAYSGAPPHHNLHQRHLDSPTEFLNMERGLAVTQKKRAIPVKKTKNKKAKKARQTSPAAAKTSPKTLPPEFDFREYRKTMSLRSGRTVEQAQDPPPTATKRG